MFLKVKICLILSMFIFPMFILFADDKVQSQISLTGDGWKLLYTWDFNASGGWNDARIKTGSGKTETREGIINFGGSKYGGYIWVPVDINITKGTRLMAIAKIRSNRPFAGIWLFSNSIFARKNINSFNEWKVDTVDCEYTRNDSRIHLVICIGFPGGPVVTIVHREGGRDVETWDKWYL